MFCVFCRYGFSVPQYICLISTEELPNKYLFGIYPVSLCQHITVIYLVFQHTAAFAYGGGRGDIVFITGHQPLFYAKLTAYFNTGVIEEADVTFASDGQDLSKAGTYELTAKAAKRAFFFM